MAPSNFIETRNPFGLVRPPQWFLDELFAQDHDAVIYPSESDPVYRLARRVRHGRPMMALLKHPDAQIAHRHRLIPAVSILPTGVSGMGWAKVLLNLQERDLWKNGGAEQYADRLDERDEREEQQLRQRTADEAYARAGDAYRLYKTLNGERLSMAHRKAEGAKTSVAQMRRSYRPVGAGRGAMFVGR